ncbi:putative metalloprotease CJM1_0395 family protein [Neptunicella sp. SCSIO 80796]|uniref:putative metalloprotease CJM1_0395 family protein n=1 Tax=Neptunicella plasticusilytica TaxID=3117012 RepID=UPI003A4D7DD3
MNIVTPLPTAIPFTTSNVNTEAARRDNQLRETIPALSNAENSAAESGLGSESDKVKTAGQTPQPVTYEKPQPNQAGNAQNNLNKDNAEDPSAGKQSAEDKQQQQADSKKIEELEERDGEVRNHERAHAQRGGQYAGSPNYEFESGPDGQRYAVGGEVSIDISEESTPEETLRKMQQVRAAALAPTEPSPQDLQVASEASQKASEARAQIAAQNNEDTRASFLQAFSDEEQNIQLGPELEDIVEGTGVDSTRRSLHEDDPVAAAGGAEVSLESGDNERFRQLLEQRDPQINQRALRITDYYLQTSQPNQPAVELSA